MQLNLSKKIIVSFSIIIILLLIGSRKSAFHLDEMLTFGLANRTYQGSFSPDIHSDSIYSGEKLWEEYTSAEHRFDYKNLWVNQAADVHPPLYYIFIHTFSSFFPGMSILWIGLLVNVFFALVVFWQMVWLFDHFLEHTKISIVFALLFIFTMGFINNVIFFRMYVLLTVWTNALIILFSYYRPSCAKNRAFYFALFGIMLGGVLTQYYFIIFSCFACLLYAVYILKYRDYKCFLYSIVTIIASIIAANIIFPALWKQIFGGNRGKEAFENMAANGFLRNLKSYFEIIDLRIFGQLFIFLLVAFCVIYIVSMSDKITMQISDAGKEYQRLFIQALLPALGYLFIVVKIAPYQTDRYVMNIMGILYLCCFSAFCHLAYKFSECSIKGVIGLAILSLICSYKQGIPYMYKEDADNQLKIEQYSDNLCIYVYDSRYTYRILWNYSEMIPLQDIAFIDNNSLEELTKFCNVDNMIVYVMDGVNPNDVFERLSTSNSNKRISQQLFRFGVATAYYVR